MYERGFQIDKCGHHDPASRVNLLRVSRTGHVLNLATGSKCLDYAISNQDRAIWNNSEIQERRSPAGSTGAAQRKQLLRSVYKG
jgi:hypothetical protein